MKVAQRRPVAPVPVANPVPANPITPWGLLNDLRPDPLDRLARKDLTRTPQQIDRLCQSLEAYRLVYLPDYLADRVRPAPSPTVEQVQRMVEGLNQGAETPWTVAEVWLQLRSIVYLLQVHR
jgi:hypothetical protein